MTRTTMITPTLDCKLDGTLWKCTGMVSSGKKIPGASLLMTKFLTPVKRIEVDVGVNAEIDRNNIHFARADGKDMKCELSSTKSELTCGKLR